MQKENIRISNSEPKNIRYYVCSLLYLKHFKNFHIMSLSLSETNSIRTPSIHVLSHQLQTSSL